MTPEQRAVIVDALRVAGAEEEARWLEHPEALRLLLLAVRAVHHSGRNAADAPLSDSRTCWDCGEGWGRHSNECRVLEALLLLGYEVRAGLRVAHVLRPLSEGQVARDRQLGEQTPLRLVK